MSNKKIVIGSDHAGFELKNKIINHLEKNNNVIIDLGTKNTESVDYPRYGKAVGEYVISNSDVEFGIVVCGSGIGISIAANKVNGIICAVVYSEEVAKLAKQHNNANVLAFGERTMDHKMVMKAIDIFMGEMFLGEQHARRVNQLKWND